MYRSETLLKLSFKLKLKIIADAVTTVLRKPRYLLLSIVTTLLMAGLIIWSLNLDLLRFIVFEAPLNLVQKIQFFVYGYQSLFSSYDSILSLGIIFFTVLFGINMSMLLYAIRQHGLASVPKKSGGGAFAFAILGGGCIACGTSLLAPVLASLGAVSAPLLRDLGTFFNWAGSILLIYSIFKLSLLIQSGKAVHALKKGGAINE